MTTARAIRLLIVAAVLLVAVVLRERAVRAIPIDFDEPVYFEAGLRYADAIRAGDPARLMNDDWHYEHPGLMKLLYAAAFLPSAYRPDDPDLPVGIFPDDLPPAQRELVLAGRRAAALFNLLTVLLLALVNPAAGALLAVHTYVIKYTSQMYLEAIPMLASTVCVLAYMRAMRASAGAGEKGSRGEREPGRKTDPDGAIYPPHPRSPAPRRATSPAVWWTISAAALGLTAAGKYIYCVAGLAVIADYLWRWAAGKRRRSAGTRQTGSGQDTPAPLLPRAPSLLPLLAWGGLSLLVFYAANPNLWPDPIGRLGASLRFHVAYPGSEVVRESAYPWYWPFYWLLQPMPSWVHPALFPVSFDAAIVALGAIGSWPMWSAYGGRGRVIVLWWAIGLAVLLLWPTKWPQYSLIIIVPLCLCAGELLRRAAIWAGRAAAGKRRRSGNRAIG